MRTALLKHLDLSFHDKAREASFVLHIEKKLVVSTAVIAALFVVGVLTSLPSELFNERDHDDEPYNYAADDARSFRFIILSSIGCVSALVLCFALCWLLFRRWSLNWEFTLTALTTIGSVLVVIGNRYTSAKLYGRDPDEVWTNDPRHATGDVALTVDAIATMTCMFAPVRMHLKWISPLSGVVAYWFCFGVWGSPFPNTLAFNVFALFSLSCCALWGAWRAEKEIRQSYLAQGVVHRKSQELEVQHAGASRILDRLCDAVVELGSDFGICQQNPRLAALLFYPTLHDMKGKSFCDLIASEEDRNRFVNALQGDSGYVEPNDVKLSSSMVQIKLCDYHGREFGVYLYHARTFGLAGEEDGNLVALVEAQERAPPDMAPLPEMSLTPIGVRDCMIEGEDSIGSSSSDVTLPMTSETSEEIKVWINALSNSLQIMKYTAAFTVFGPMASESNLVTIVEDSKELLRWIQRAVNTKIVLDQDPAQQPLTLKLRNSPHSRAEYTARCSIDFSTFIWDDQSDCVLLCLIFDNVRCRHRRLKSATSRLNQAMKSPERGYLLSSVIRKSVSL